MWHFSSILLWSAKPDKPPRTHSWDVKSLDWTHWEWKPQGVWNILKGTWQAAAKASLQILGSWRLLRSREKVCFRKLLKSVKVWWRSLARTDDEFAPGKADFWQQDIYTGISTLKCTAPSKFNLTMEFLSTEYGSWIPAKLGSDPAPGSCLALPETQSWLQN